MSGILVRPHNFQELAHIVAQPSWAQKAQDTIIARVDANLARYTMVPLNAFERVQLLNSVLIPWWPYYTMFIPHDRMFHHID